MMMFVRFDDPLGSTAGDIYTGASILSINHNNWFDGVVGYHVSLTSLAH